MYDPVSIGIASLFVAGGGIAVGASSARKARRQTQRQFRAQQAAIEEAEAERLREKEEGEEQAAASRAATRANILRRRGRRSTIIAGATPLGGSATLG